MSTSIRLVISAVAWLMFAEIGIERAAAMGLEAFGPAGEHIGRSPDWPKGVEDVLRHRSRVYWYDVNGGEAAYYYGDIQTANELLDLYSRVDLVEHPVAIRPGRPSAKSFDGRLVPYVVEFDDPAGIYLDHARELASTGLYSVTPRLILHFDAALAEHLDELKVPENVTLHEFAIRVDDALAHTADADLGMRQRAILALGDAADSSEASTKVLKRAAEDENKSIRAAGETALAQIAAAQDPAELALRRRLADFVDGHPQRAKVLSPQELLAALRKSDAEYAKGFTARGTRVEPAPSGPGTLVAWTVTMSQDRIVVEQRNVEDADHPPAAGRFEYTIYAGPERMGAIHGYRLWVDGKLIEAKPQATFEPVGSTYDLLVGRTLWPLGRDYIRRIDHITGISTGADGLLTVAAESDGDLVFRWELLIDPHADFLVRAAKGFRRDDTTPLFVVETAGVLAGGERNVAHTARWIEGAAGEPASVAVTSVSATADSELIQRTEDRLDKLPRLEQ
jgi:hypothetical protein